MLIHQKHKFISKNMHGYLKKGFSLALFSSITALAILPLVSAAVPGPGETFMTIIEYVVNFFGFEWLRGMGENATVAFVRFLCFLAIAKLVHIGIGFSPLNAHLDSKSKLIFSIIIALLGTIGIPKALIIALVTLYTTIAILVLLALGCYGIWLLFSRIPPTSLFSIALICILIVILISLSGALTVLIATN